MPADSRVSALCAEFGIELVSKHTTPGPGQTRAPAALRKIIEASDEGTARIVLRTLTETANKAPLDREVIGAAFDLLRACKGHYEADPERWFECWDITPVAELQSVAHDLRGVVPIRAALSGLIYERIWRAFGPRSIQPDLLDDRRQFR